eukprot:10269201-Ditylum_brightwellii.AAC.1
MGQTPEEKAPQFWHGQDLLNSLVIKWWNLVCGCVGQCTNAIVKGQVRIRGGGVGTSWNLGGSGRNSTGPMHRIGKHKEGVQRGVLARIKTIGEEERGADHSETTGKIRELVMWVLKVNGKGSCICKQGRKS